MSIEAYAKEKGIADTTSSGWIKADRNLEFGAIEVKNSVPPLPRTIKLATVFATENMRIELKEGYNKELLKFVIGILINDWRYSKNITVAE